MSPMTAVILLISLSCLMDPNEFRTRHQWLPPSSLQFLSQLLSQTFACAKCWQALGGSSAELYNVVLCGSKLKKFSQSKTEKDARRIKPWPDLERFADSWEYIFQTFLLEGLNMCPSLEIKRRPQMISPVFWSVSMLSEVLSSIQKTV